MIRKAVSEDLEQILTVLSAAKAFMVKTGNAAQWEPGYPDTVISGDIAAGNCYVEEEVGTIHGVFVCIPGDDPTYRVIENGRWLNDRPYATIHRAGSDGALPGFFGRCLAFCRTLCPDLRADTHADNHVMQHLLEKNGFHPCGTIYAQDGRTRIAYQLEA